MSDLLMNVTEIRAFLAGNDHEPLTEMAISKFVKAGMPKRSRGLYDPIACARWYMGELRTKAHIRESKVRTRTLAQLAEIGL